MDAVEAVALIVQDVAELPDRTSPDDAPDMMLVTADELTEIVQRHLTVALAAARPFIAAEWQPIETAPKDGSRLLAGRFAAGCKHDGLIVVDSYATPQQMRGWTGFGKFNEYHWPATHWQPLPAPPTAIKETIR